MSRYIKLNENFEVIAVRYGEDIVDGEIESEVGEIGQLRQNDGTFITPEPTPTEPQPTLEELQMQTLLNTEYLVVLAELTV